MKKAQISPEMLMSIGAAILIFFLVLLLIADKRENLRDLESYVSERETCIQLADAIVNAYTDGITTELTIYYNATISPNVLRVGIVTCTYPINTVSNLTNNIFTINNGQVRIEMQGENVTIQNV